MACLLGLARAALVVFAVQAGTAMAWSEAGHRIVAAMAEARLSPGVDAQVRALLAVSGAQSMADVAGWADDVRKDPQQRELARATTKLHFINFADARCRYDAARDCPGGQCIVAGIDHYTAVLADRKRPDAERAEALRFLVHFVGDVHQPLHAGYRSDRGGNDHQLQFDGKGTNLHAIWDTQVLRSRRLGWRAYADAIQPRPDLRAAGTPRDWAEESCRISRDDGLYPRSRKLREAYLARMRPLAERRLRLAAVRLADRLEAALGRD
ncbi:MAG: S1/P1 nuclease [Dokdonella sp.]|nr:S1/P1 nuclease [Dokdonella sp.]MCW5567707.1 S1/P1 nuclease [Dokdonella sp.]